MAGGRRTALAWPRPIYRRCAAGGPGLRVLRAVDPCAWQNPQHRYRGCPRRRWRAGGADGGGHESCRRRRYLASPPDDRPQRCGADRAAPPRARRRSRHAYRRTAGAGGGDLRGARPGCGRARQCRLRRPQAPPPSPPADPPGNPEIDWQSPPSAGGANAKEVAGIIAAAPRVARISQLNQRIAAATMEPRGGTASYDAATDSYTMRVCSQSAIVLRDGLAAAMCIEPGKLRVVTQDVGGAFGMKKPVYPEYPP